MMGLDWKRVAAGFTYVRGVSKGVMRGHIFPPEGRQPIGDAPGGSEDPQPKMGPLARFKHEQAAFTEPRHVLPVPGLRVPVEILQLSDVHLRGEDDWLDALCAKVAALRPDLVVLTGDVVAREWTRGAVDRFLAALPDAPLGRYAVMGNWEHWAKATPAIWRPIVEAQGVRLLLEDHVDLGAFSLGGTDDYMAGQPDPERLIAALPADKPAVVLSHSPGIFPALAHSPVRLVLSGHSHAGQARLPGLGSFWVPRGTGPYIGGWYKQGDTSLYVSRGVGWSIAPVRLWCPPELVTIRLIPD